MVQFILINTPAPTFTRIDWRKAKIAPTATCVSINGNIFNYCHSQGSIFNAPECYWFKNRETGECVAITTPDRFVCYHCKKRVTQRHKREVITKNGRLRSLCDQCEDSISLSIDYVGSYKQFPYYEVCNNCGSYQCHCGTFDTESLPTHYLFWSIIKELEFNKLLPDHIISELEEIIPWYSDYPVEDSSNLFEFFNFSQLKGQIDGVSLPEIWRELLDSDDKKVQEVIKKYQ